MKVIVIGAGASGIIAALKASEKNKVLLIEKNDKIGKKILVTGNGKCNLWNTNLNNQKIDLSNYYYTDNYDKLNKIFLKRNDTYLYLKNELNIYMREKNNYVYPYSNTAVSVRSLLERTLENNKNIDIIYNCYINKIKKIDNKFIVYSDNSKYEADKIIISCGGLASNLGTNSINNLFNNIKINKCMPSLVPITASDSYLKDLNGIRTDVKLSLYDDNKLLKEEIGEVQFTDYGISGIVSLNLSSYIKKINKPKLYIDFMPDISDDNLKKVFNTSFYNKNNKTIEELLETYFNYKLMFIILKKANIDRNTIYSNITDKEIDKLIKAIKHFDINITGTLDFDRAQVMTGGISLNEVNDNLELKKINGLYVVGEILDIDGICGGYNLASAFITGFIAGSDIND
jgi:hypothetical protein